jgi:hypothetical protein
MSDDVNIARSLAATPVIWFESAKSSMWIWVDAIARHVPRAAIRQFPKFPETSLSWHGAETVDFRSRRADKRHNRLRPLPRSHIPGSWNVIDLNWR